MPIKFSDMLDEEDESVLHPRDIFFTLNRAPTFSFPRDIQTEVMNRWFENRETRDCVIKLNVMEVEDLRAGVALLSRDLVSELGHEIRDIHPAAEDVIYAFTGCSRELSHDDIVLALMEAKVPDGNHEKVLQLLLWYGFLGVLDDDNEPKFIYQVQYNSKMLETYRQRRTSKAKCFPVNPAFWPSLNVKFN